MSQQQAPTSIAKRRRSLAANNFGNRDGFIMRTETTGSDHDGAQSVASTSTFTTPTSRVGGSTPGSSMNAAQAAQTVHKRKKSNKDASEE